MDEQHPYTACDFSPVGPSGEEGSQEGWVRQRKEAGGFWIPNPLIDLHLADLGAEGVAVYCVLARCVTPRHYPSVSALAGLLKRGSRVYPERRIVRVLKLLHERRLINDADLRAIGDAGKLEAAEATATDDPRDDDADS